MESPDTRFHCRFCAERKHSEKLIQLDANPEQLAKVLHKLNTLNLKLFNSENDVKFLSYTVCFVCWTKFNESWEFYQRFEKAQLSLRNLYHEKFDATNLPSTNLPNKSNFTSDTEDTNIYDDTLPLKAESDDDEPLVKLKKSSTQEKHLENPHNIDIIPQEIPSNILAPEWDLNLALDQSIITGTNQLYNQDIKYNIGYPSNEFNPPDAVTKENPTCNNINTKDILNSIFASTSNNEESIPFHTEIYCKEVLQSQKKVIKKWRKYPWICRYCSKILSDIQSLRDHSLQVHAMCLAFTCIDCVVDNQKSYRFDNFIRHVKKHRVSLRLICPYCDKKTENYREHMKTHCTETSSTKCTDCGELFPNEKELTKHKSLLKPKLTQKRKRRKKGEAITLEDLTCDVCLKVYRNLNVLRDHKRTLHSIGNRRVFTCDRCGKSFLSKGSLVTHLMGHDNIAPYQCRVCNKGFKFPGLLRKHVDTHSGIKRFACDQCGRAFRLRWQMLKHKIIHTDIMPYVCQFCPKTFRFKSILDIHERRHTGAKPYSCAECGRDFANWSNFYKHSQRKHGIDLRKKKFTPTGWFPVNPETGKVYEMEVSEACEEWKKQVMLPSKRGPKKGSKRSEVSASVGIS